MAEETDERWIHGSAIQFEETFNVVYITRYGTGLEILFREGYNRSLLAPIPTPNATKGWKVKSIMLRYSISIAPSEFGFSPEIFRISLYDLDRLILSYTYRNFRSTGGMFQNIKQDLPLPKNFNHGIGVLIGVRYDYIEGAPRFSFVSFAGVGLKFVKSL